MAFELIRPFKESRVLITFEFGGTKVHATTWKSDFPFRGDTYESEPGIEIELPKQTGGLNEEFMKMELPLTRGKVNSKVQSLAALLASPRAMAKLTVEIKQLIVDGQEQAVYYIYEGVIERARANPDGRDGLVSVEFATELRSGLDVISLGRRCDPECDAVFGGNGCGHPDGFGKSQYQPADYFPNQYAKTRSAWVICTIDANNPRKAHLELDPAVYPAATPSQRVDTWAGQPPGWWIGSFLKKDGVTIQIQSWQQSQTFVILSRIPPKVWDGASVFLQLDCPRTAEQCSLRNRQTYFNGLGYGIPAYNPALDLPNEST